MVWIEFFQWIEIVDYERGGGGKTGVRVDLPFVFQRPRSSPCFSETKIFPLFFRDQDQPRPTKTNQDQPRARAYQNNRGDKKMRGISEFSKYKNNTRYFLCGRSATVHWSSSWVLLC
jgi:hypothetical protein